MKEGERETETERTIKREKFNKYLLNTYCVSCTFPGGQTGDHMMKNMLDMIFFGRRQIL